MFLHLCVTDWKLGQETYLVLMSIHQYLTMKRFFVESCDKINTRFDFSVTECLCSLRRD